MRLYGITAMLVVAGACAPASAPSNGAATGARPGAATSDLSAPAPSSRALEKVTLRLDWTYWGGHAPFFVAVEKGLYAERGLEVSINEGKGSQGTVTLVGEAKEDFGHADASTAAVNISKGLPALMVAVFHGKGPSSLISLETTDLRSPKDVEGKRVAITPGSSSTVAWEVFAARNGIDVSKVDGQNMPGDVKTQALLAGRIDATVGQGFFEIPILASKGMRAKELLFSDYGVTMLNFGIVTSKKLAQERPSVVRGFLAATQQGYDLSLTNIDEAMAILQKHSPLVEVDVARQQFLNQQQQMRTRNSEGKPLGWQSTDDWNETLDILQKYGGLEPRLANEQYFTNQFLP
jgi:NitT/TauT family transport system substrate-binding protein